MLFKKEDRVTKDFGVDLQVHEYRNDAGEQGGFPIDGAMAEINKAMPPKIQEFDELFLMISGELEITIDDVTTTLMPEDMFIVPRGKAHTIVGRHAKVFIVCSPPFDSAKMKMV